MFNFYSRGFNTNGGTGKKDLVQYPNQLILTRASVLPTRPINERALFTVITDFVNFRECVVNIESRQYQSQAEHLNLHVGLQADILTGVHMDKKPQEFMNAINDLVTRLIESDAYGTHRRAFLCGARKIDKQLPSDVVKTFCQGNHGFAITIGFSKEDTYGFDVSTARETTVGVVNQWALDHARS